MHARSPPAPAARALMSGAKTSGSPAPRTSPSPMPTSVSTPIWIAVDREDRPPVGAQHLERGDGRRSSRRDRPAPRPRCRPRRPRARQARPARGTARAARPRVSHPACHCAHRATAARRRRAPVSRSVSAAARSVPSGRSQPVERVEQRALADQPRGREVLRAHQRSAGRSRSPAVALSGTETSAAMATKSWSPSRKLSPGASSSRSISSGLSAAPGTPPCPANSVGKRHRRVQLRRARAAARRRPPPSPG